MVRVEVNIFKQLSLIIGTSSIYICLNIGPSVAYDSNWVGGIEVLRLAYSAIKTGQCESVIIGTANLALNSEFQWIYNDMGLLSSDGSTKAFDADGKRALKLITENLNPFLCS